MRVAVPSIFPGSIPAMCRCRSCGTGRRRLWRSGYKSSKTDRTLFEENLKSLLHYDNFSGTEYTNFTALINRNRKVHALRAWKKMLKPLWPSWVYPIGALLNGKFPQYINQVFLDRFVVFDGFRERYINHFIVFYAYHHITLSFHDGVDCGSTQSAGKDTVVCRRTAATLQVCWQGDRATHL